MVHPYDTRRDVFGRGVRGSPANFTLGTKRKTKIGSECAAGRGVSGSVYFAGGQRKCAGRAGFWQCTHTFLHGLVLLVLHARQRTMGPGSGRTVSRNAALPPQTAHRALSGQPARPARHGTAPPGSTRPPPGSPGSRAAPCVCRPGCCARLRQARTSAVSTARYTVGSGNDEEVDPSWPSGSAQRVRCGGARRCQAVLSARPRVRSCAAPAGPRLARAGGRARTDHARTTHGARTVAWRLSPTSFPADESSDVLAE